MHMITSMGRHTAWVGLLLGVVTSAPGGADAVEQPDIRTVDYTIIATGHELLDGTYADGHTHFLTRTLRPLGFHCVGSMSVDDEPADIKQALQFACSRSPLVVVTGGLGPTDSDITREVLSQYTGIPLEEHPDVLKDMEQRFNTPREKLRANLRRQTRVPTRGTYLKNSAGSAVGLLFESDTALIVALPGPPRELQTMVRDELVPELTRRFGSRSVGCSMTIRFIGIGQSQIDQTMKEHIHLLDDIFETSQFEGGRVDFTFALPNDRPEDRKRLEELRGEFYQHLGEFIYADDATTTLEDCVSQRLLAAGHTVATAEVGTGGGLAAALCHTELAPRVLAGAFVAASGERLRTLLNVGDQDWDTAADAERLALLATAVATRAHSQWVVVVDAPRQSAPSQAPQVSVCIRRPDGTVLLSVQRWPGVSSSAQAAQISELLDRLRRALQPPG